MACATRSPASSDRLRPASGCGLRGPPIVSLRHPPKRRAPTISSPSSAFKVEFPGEDDAVLEILSNVSFSIRRGETLGLVGESGSGKSMTALALLGLVPKPGQVTAGSIRFGGRDLTAISGSGA